MGGYLGTYPFVNGAVASVRDTCFDGSQVGVAAAHHRVDLALEAVHDAAHRHHHADADADGQQRQRRARLAPQQILERHPAKAQAEEPVAPRASTAVVAHRLKGNEPGSAPGRVQPAKNAQQDGDDKCLGEQPDRKLAVYEAE